MKIIFTEQSIESLKEVLDFLAPKVSQGKLEEIGNRLLDKTDLLITNPFIGEKEVYLEHLNQNHRRLIEGNYKIIYKVVRSTIYITDFFDTRQDPSKMKG